MLPRTSPRARIPRCANGYDSLRTVSYTHLFRELGPEEAAERDRIRAQAAARVREAERHRREAECLFEYRFSCSPYSAMAYEAFHPELCERRVSKRRKQELVVYRLPEDVYKRQAEMTERVKMDGPDRRMAPCDAEGAGR